MKKSLLALAMLGAFAGAAHAQSSVTIYGIADVAIERFDSDANDGAAWRLSSGQQSGSRIGFRGTEDLGGGLKANFVLENGFRIDDGRIAQQNAAGQDLLFGRQAWVGLSGGFGAIKFGRQLTPIFVAQDTVDPFGTGLSFGGDGMAGAFNPYGVRMNNTVNYSFSAAGFSGELAYGFGEVPGSTADSRQIGAGGSYVNGPITAVVAFHRTEGAAGAALDNARTLLLGGAFDFRVAKLHAAAAVNRTDLTAGGDTRSRDYMLGVSAPIGAAGSVVASYMMNDDREAANNDVDYWAVGYVHNLSKRTNLYTTYSTRRPDDNSDANWFNVGIRHKF